MSFAHLFILEMTATFYSVFYGINDYIEIAVDNIARYMTWQKPFTS